MKLIEQTEDHWTEQARQVATAAHAGQTRNNGDPYIVHPERVANSVDTRLKPIAWLHDVVEDTKVTLEDLKQIGFPSYVIQAVDLLTHKKGMSNVNYWKEISKNSDATKVKIADITDNIGDSPSEHAKEKYAKALRFFASLDQPSQITESQVEEGLIRTHPVDVSIRILQKAFPQFRFQTSEEDDDIIVSVREIDKHTLGKLIKMIDVLGWFPAHFAQPDDFGNLVVYDDGKFLDEVEKVMAYNKETGDEYAVTLYLRAKFGLVVPPDKYKDFYYHVTPMEYKDKILRVGLVPKAKNKASIHPPRIYMGNSPDAVNLLLDHPKFYTGVTEFVVLSINAKKLKQKYPEFTIFHDPDFTSYGTWTYHNIPPEFIEIEGTASRDDDGSSDMILRRRRARKR